MTIDSDNPVVALCAAGIAIEGDAPAARRLFEQAWEVRRDDYDASIAAHFLARHQATVEDRLAWNVRAARHAEVVADDRARELKPSLYLNLADAYLATGDRTEARAAIVRAAASLDDLPLSGYRDFVKRGIDGVLLRLDEFDCRRAEHLTNVAADKHFSDAASSQRL
jgi:tetratricopeptide (TPR) repeat protein